MSIPYHFELGLFRQGRPLLSELNRNGLEFDQRLMRALEVSASRPNLKPEDSGFPDSYLTLALYRLNSVLSRVVELKDQRFNLFHEYRLAPRCRREQVVPGNRLCWVLDKAIQLAAPGKTIGVGHFLRAVVSLTLDEEPEEAYGFPGQVIHNTFSAETFLWGLGYTAWTPISRAPEIREVLNALDGRSPIDDTQYLLTTEGKRLVLRPTSVLDRYRMPRDSGAPADRLALLTHLRDGYAATTPDEILELEDLINNTRVSEPELQEFFERHPQFLRIWDHREVHPQVYLTREIDGPLIPDFLLLDRELHRATVVELKLASARIIVRKRNRDRFSSLITEARAQLLEYREWFDDAHNRRMLKERLGMEIYRPRLGVVIGRSDSFADEFDRQKLVSHCPDVEIATYDDVMRYAERRLTMLRQATKFE
jgi:hypothetical protein